MNGRPRYDKEQLIEFLVSFCKEHGRVPQRRDFNHVKNTPSPSFGQYKRAFGSWGTAILESGLRDTIRARTHVELVCEHCGHLFHRVTSRSRDKFCSLECSHKAEFGTKGTHCSRTHKAMAVVEYGRQCERCGYHGFTEYYSKRMVNSVYDQVPVSLHVHHIDGNRKNNDIENLSILCPNCHGLDRSGITIYWRDAETNKLCWKDKTLDEWNTEIEALREIKRAKGKLATRKLRERMRQSAL